MLFYSNNVCITTNKPPITGQCIAIIGTINISAEISMYVYTQVLATVQRRRRLFYYTPPCSIFTTARYINPADVNVHS